MNYKVMNIRLAGHKWKADVTTWEGCCSNVKITTVALEQKKRPSGKDFIKEMNTRQDSNLYNPD